MTATTEATGVWARCDNCQHAWPLTSFPVKTQGMLKLNRRRSCPVCHHEPTLMLAVGARLTRKFRPEDVL